MKTIKGLGIAFLTGLILVGLGSGIAFAEFSSFEYGGEKQIIGVTTETKTYTKAILAKELPIVILKQHHGIAEAEIVADSNMDDDTISFEVTYNSERIEPLGHGIASDIVREDVREVVKQIIDDDGETDTITEMETREVIHYFFEWYDKSSDWDEFNAIIQGFKEKKFYSFEGAGEIVEKMVVSVSPNNLGRVKIK